ncbi:MAG: hypothetical protein Q4C58_16140 [Eubacteriales bacterium]|nr:hypothetical protein [Eubacteriales bacterium]
MFSIRVEVGKIGYEKTMTTLFPAALRKCRKLQSPNLLIRLFLELGEDAMPVLLGIMDKLPENAKQELLCQCMNSYRTVLTEKLNEYLRADDWGKNFVIQSIYMERTDDGVALVGDGVSVDYGTLLKNEDVRAKINNTAASFNGLGKVGKIFAPYAGNALKKMVEVAPEETEKLGLLLLQKEEIKQKLMGLARTALQKRELELELKELSIVPVEKADLIQDAGAAAKSLKISAELENELIKAIAEYLKMAEARAE